MYIYIYIHIQVAESVKEIENKKAATIAEADRKVAEAVATATPALSIAQLFKDSGNGFGRGHFCKTC